MATITGGQTLICSGSVTFGSSGLQAGQQWVVSTNLTLSSTSTTSATVTVNGQGAAWIAILNPDGKTHDAHKDLWLGKPIITITGPSSTPNGQYADFYAYLPPEAGVSSTGFQWILNPQLNNNVYGANTYHFTVAFYTAGTYQVVCRATNSCGTGDYTTTGVNVY